MTNDNKHDPRVALKAGTILNNGRYEIISEMGRGGFGITYKAEEVHNDFTLNYTAGTRPGLVIKELFSARLCIRMEPTLNVRVLQEADKEAWGEIKSFMRAEGGKISEFDHPNIVKVKRTFLENDTVYTVFEYIDGEDMGKMLERMGRPLPPLAALPIFKQLLSALSYMHTRHTYHFDIKPENIMIEQGTGRVVLIDFGTACTFRGDNGSFDSGMYSKDGLLEERNFNSERYSAPEMPHIAFGKINERHDRPATIDTYGVGACLYRCITGKIPPDPELRLYGRAPLFEVGFSRSGLYEVIEHSMRFNPSERFQSAIEFKRALNFRLYIQLLWQQFQSAMKFKQARNDKDILEEKQPVHKGETKDELVKSEKKKLPHVKVGKPMLWSAVAVVIAVVLFVIIKQLPATQSNDVKPDTTKAVVVSKVDTVASVAEVVDTMLMKKELAKADSLFDKYDKNIDRNTSNINQAIKMYKKCANILSAKQTYNLADMLCFILDYRDSTVNYYCHVAVVKGSWRAAYSLALTFDKSGQSDSACIYARKADSLESNKTYEVKGLLRKLKC